VLFILSLITTAQAMVKFTVDGNEFSANLQFVLSHMQAIHLTGGSLKGFHCYRDSTNSRVTKVGSSAWIYRYSGSPTTEFHRGCVRYKGNLFQKTFFPSGWAKDEILSYLVQLLNNRIFTSTQCTGEINQNTKTERIIFEVTQDGQVFRVVLDHYPQIRKTFIVTIYPILNGDRGIGFSEVAALRDRDREEAKEAFRTREEDDKTMVARHTTQPDIRTYFSLVDEQDLECLRQSSCIEDINALSSRKTALMLAIEKNNEAIILHLLNECGANVNRANDEGITPVMCAVKLSDRNEDSLNVVSLLLEHNADITTKTNATHETALDMAIKRCDFLTVLILVNSLDCSGRSVDCKNKALCTAASYGISSADEERDITGIIKLLIDSGASANCTHRGLTPLMCAASQSQSIPILKLLLISGANPDTRTCGGDTALIRALRRNMLKNVRLLITVTNARLESSREGIDLAIARNYNNECSALLLDHYEKRRHCIDDKGYTPVHYYSRMSKYMLQRLGDISECINTQTYKGKTALMFAVKQGTKSIVKYLLENGADVLVKDSMGNTVLSYVKAGKVGREIRELLKSTESTQLARARRSADEQRQTLMQQFSQEMTMSEQLSRPIMEYLSRSRNVDGRLNKKRQTALIIATISRKIKIVIQLLEIGADVMLIDKEGHVALNYAVENNDGDMITTLTNNYSYEHKHLAVELLVRSRMERYLPIDIPQLPSLLLEYAIEHQREDLANEIIRSEDSVPLLSSPLIHGNLPLHLALLGDNICIQRLLIEHTPSESLNCCNGNNESPLHLAARMNNLEAVKQLLSRDVLVTPDDLEVTENPDIQEILANILNKIAREEVERVARIEEEKRIVAEEKAIIEKEERVRSEKERQAEERRRQEDAIRTNERVAHSKEKKRIIAKQKAIAEEERRARKEEEKSSKEKAICTKRKSVLHEKLLLHAQNGKLKEINALLEHSDIDVNARRRDGFTALILAAHYGYVAIVELLLLYPDIEVNARNDAGCTALMAAAHEGHEDVAEQLLEHGANINARDPLGYVALVYAARNGHITVVERLLLYPGIKVNTRGYDGCTALLLAAKNGHKAIVERLLEHPDIDVNARNRDGDTALMYAVHAGHEAIAEILRCSQGE